ncbi:MAG: trigger factor [candidate division WOR-3 bacterium]
MDTKREIVIKISNEEIENKMKEVALEYGKSVSIKGFRPGKAPVDVILSKYRDEIENETIEKLTENKIVEIVKNEKIKMIPPVYIKEKIKKDNEYEIKVEFEIIPDFDVLGYHNLKVKRRIKRITPADIEEKLKYYQETLAEFYPKEEGIEDGDFVHAKYSVFDENGKVILSAREEKFTFDEKNVSEVFYENLKGKKKGDNVEIVTQEKDKKFIYKVKIIDVRRKVLPEINDEFAKSFDFENLEEFKNSIEKELMEGASKIAEREMENEILKKLLEINKFNVPESLIEDELSLMIDEYKIKEEDIKEFKEKFREVARERVRAKLLLDKIAEKIGAKVSPSEIDEEVKKMAKEYNADFLSFKANLKKRGILKLIETDILRRKAMEFLKSQVKTEVIIE